MIKENDAFIEKRWSEIEKWEKKLAEESRSIKKTDRSRNIGIPLKSLMETMDRYIVHTNAMMLHPHFYEEAKNSILYQARMFRNDITSIDDLRKLPFHYIQDIYSYHQSKQRLLALGQGGITGIGGSLFLVSDLPAIIILNLRTVQLSALCYGYDLRKPYEMMIAVKVFHGAMLPRKSQKEAWNRLNEEVFPKNEELLWLYEGEENILYASWLQQPLQHIGKLMLLAFLQKSKWKGLALFRMAIGATWNHQLIKKVSEWSGYFYEKRYLMENINK